MPKHPLGRVAVYRLYGCDDDLLYVGIGELPAMRWQDHRAHKDWWPEVHRAEVVWRASRQEAEAEELRCIETDKPRYNVMGTYKHHKPRARSVQMPVPVVQAKDIAAALDLTPAYVSQFLSKKRGFPQPCALGPSGRNRKWNTAEVVAWVNANRQPLSDAS